MSFCSDCGEPLGSVVYTEHCGPHLLADFVPTTGYIISVADLYGDWDCPDYFVCPADELGERKRIWKHKDGCCYWREIPEEDDRDYCRMCQDVMVPAKAGVSKAETP